MPMNNSRRKLTASQIITLYENQNGKCPYCGDQLYALAIADGHNLAIDHMVPLCAGGKSELSNYAIACSWCNRKKRFKSTEEFMREMLPYRVRTEVSDGE